MNFVHPEFLYLTPLLAVPVLIHLLNRIRYRRVRWAAIDFLLNTERRAVRRARLRQILLMILRTLLLAAALGALLQPILGGGLAALVGGSSQVAVLVDASASMSATDASGRAFDIARKLATRTLASLSRNARVMSGTFATRYHSPFREPLKDHQAVASVLESTKLTGGGSDIPRSIRAATEPLRRSGGGGAIWLLTDLRAGGWQIADSGIWEETHQALKDAGNPRLIVTDLGPRIDANFAITGLRTRPGVLIENDVPKVAATVQLHGDAGGATSVALTFEGRRIDRRVLQFAEPGKKEVVFSLPKVSAGNHVGCIELEPDAVPADDRYHFVLRVTGQIPVLVVEGAPSSIPFEGAADFLALATQPPASEASTRSSFSAKRVSAEQLGSTDVKEFAAVLLADVPRLEPQTVKQLSDYVSAGGLLILFPGEHTDIAAWNESGFPGLPMKSIVEAKAEKPFKVNRASPTSPVTMTLPVEGMDRLMIRRILRFKGRENGGAADGQVLATTNSGDPFLVCLQMGRGKAYIFGVSCQADFSNLPFTPVLLLTVHRAILTHLMQVGEPPARAAFDELNLSLPPGRCQVLTPDGRLLPAARPFADTGLTGIYRLVEGDAAPEDPEAAPAVAAINVPPEESALDRIDARTIRGLLPGYPMQILRITGGEQLTEGTGARSAASSFPLATLAMMCLLGEVLLAWRIGRPIEDKAQVEKSQT